MKELLKRRNVIIVVALFLCSLSTTSFADIYTPPTYQGLGISVMVLLGYVAFALLALWVIFSLLSAFVSGTAREKINSIQSQLLYYGLLSIVLLIASLFGAIGSLLFIVAAISYITAFFSLYYRLLKKDERKSLEILKYFILIFIVSVLLINVLRSRFNTITTTF